MINPKYFSLILAFIGGGMYFHGGELFEKGRLEYDFFILLGIVELVLACVFLHFQTKEKKNET